MRLTNFLLIILGMLTFLTVQAQQNDTTKIVKLNEIEIKVQESIGGIERMPQISENVIYSGKKTEVIKLDKINADLSTNNTRQVFAKVPGMSIWENDGSGIQVSVATRGLSPNRSWEFNVRQNGYDICSEVFGYPESYYSPPMEAVEKIEVIRGAASLQFGPQFGGLLNYKIKKGNHGKPLAFETQQTVGSYGLFNTYNALGGTYKKFSYYGFLHHRTADGWRENSRYNIYTGFMSANYQVSQKLNIGFEYTRMNYKSQQAGGLTDAQFMENHRQSFRERNWLSTPWNVASLLLNYNISKSVSIQIKSFATHAERNSVGFTKAITILDTINPNTLTYESRQIDRDQYKNYGAEARTSIQYKILGKNTILAGGLRAYRGSTKRNQLGMGTTESDFDLSLTNPQYGKSLQFITTNYAAFAENIFHIGKRWKLVPGLRYDYIENNKSGYINTTQAGMLNPEKRARQIFLYGIGSEFFVTEKSNLYTNYSRAYRPVTYSELTPSTTTEIIDPNLKDAKGFNADFGYRGTFYNFLSLDIGLFYLHYNNRIGTITQDGKPFKTNIGTSVSKGLESFVEIDVIKIFTEKSRFGYISLYASNSFIDAKYVKWNNPAISSDPLKSIENKRVENAPQYIHRFGTTYYLNEFSLTFQYSSIGNVYTDAANTVTPNSTATIGKLPGYQVMDASFTYKFIERYNIKAGINNLSDQKYATRRSGGYPGPGILPANGRTFFISLGASF